MFDAHAVRVTVDLNAAEVVSEAFTSEVFLIANW